nr:MULTISPECIES: GNAT family N-acetyltransferase [Pandoraea]
MSTRNQAFCVLNDKPAGTAMSGIFSTSEKAFDAITELWEASVRATHDFLSEADIAWLRPRIRNEYLAAVTLRVFRDDANVIRGFVGVAEGNVEMLFVAPDARRQGIGAALLAYAVRELGCTRVDVNEQNPQALAFYRREGFEVTGRSPLDGQGRPFPLLHMQLASAPTGHAAGSNA